MAQNLQNSASLSLNLKVAGLYTNPSPLASDTPPGKLSVASNAVLRRPGIIEKRRGFNIFGTAFPDVSIPTATLYQFFNYDGIQLVPFTQNRVAYDSQAKAAGAFTVVSYVALTGATLQVGDIVLTEGVEWTAATSNADTSESLYNACLAIDYNNGTVPVLFTRDTTTEVDIQAVYFGSFFNSIALISSNPTNLAVTGAGTLTGGIDPGTWQNLTGILPNPGVGSFRVLKHYAVEASKNFYITSGGGTVKLDSPTGSLLYSGGIPGLDGVAAVGVSGAGFMSNLTQVGYRMTWADPDLNHTSGITGTPSQRAIAVNNSGASQNVDLEFTIPKGVTEDTIYRIYRSVLSASVSTPPDDELQLVLEGNVTNADIALTFFQITDSTPQSLRGAALYTNSSQEGIAQENTIPPSSIDITTFKGFTVYSNIKTQQKFPLTLLAVGATEGVQVGDTLTINLTASNTNYIFTGAASEDVSLAEFLVDTGGTPAENIEATALSLVRVINRAQLLIDSVAVYAFYESGVGDSPGQILLEEWNAEGIEFTVISSRSTCWSPALPTSSGPSSSQGGEQHQVLISKENQPEAVPLANKLSIGSENFPIYRVISLRDSIIVMKGDGIFRLTGSSLPFQITPVDGTVVLSAIDSAKTANNFVYAYTNKGIVEITDTSSPNVISIPVDNILKEISQNPNFFLSTFGFVYETEYEFGIAYTLSPSRLTADSALIYNTVTKEWYTWEFPVPIWSAQVSPIDNQMYLASASDDFPYVYRERKGLNSADYADAQVEVDIISYTGTTLTLASTTGLVVGETIAQFDNTTDEFVISQLTGQSVLPLNKAIITSIVDATQIVVSVEADWDVDNANTYVFTPFEWRIKTLPNATGNAAVLKRFQRWAAYFADIDFLELQTTLTTNLSPANEVLATQPFIPVRLTGWGDTPWGNGPWGGETGDVPVYILRGDVERNAARGHMIFIEVSNAEALTSVNYLGLAISYYPMTQSLRGFR